jgi:predicted N-acetyltransferase YhbS
VEIRALRDSDDRSGFRCGDADLDRFFQKYAGQNQFRHHIGATYVAVEKSRIAGYATVAPGEIEAQKIASVDRKKFPRYPLPILRLARLAVDESFRGQGLGGMLLRFVFELALTMAQDLGCVGIVVDAKPGAESFYLPYGFISLAAVAGSSPARPQPDAMFLATARIRACLLGLPTK